MWSIGVLLYVLLTGCSPFGGETKQETFCNISKGELDFPDDLFEGISETVKDLMRHLMVKDPRSRLTANQCLEHEWFQVEKVPTSHTTNEPDCQTEEMKSKPLSRVPSVRVNVELRMTVEEDKCLRTFQSVVGHKQQNGRGADLIRKSSLRRSADHGIIEIKKATSCNTAPIQLHLSRNKFETVQARPAIVEVSSPTDPPTPTTVFIETPPRALIPSQQRPASDDLPSVTNSETSSITSDAVSEMSVDSSGYCSSIMSSEDSLDWENVWDKVCAGSVARAFSKFNLSPNTRLAKQRAMCTSTPTLTALPDNNKYGLQLFKERHGDEIVIREMKAGRISRLSEVKCESLRSRIQKLQARSQRR